MKYQKKQEQESLYMIPIRFFTGLMVVLFGLSICATYADAGLNGLELLNETLGSQIKTPENIRIYPLASMNQIQIRWQGDDHMATGYAIYKNGILYDTSRQAFYNDDWPTTYPGTIYEITAYDIHGNESFASDPIFIQSYEKVSTDRSHEESAPVAKRLEKEWTR
jgi:hypothetical protein